MEYLQNPYEISSWSSAEKKPKEVIYLRNEYWVFA